MTNVLANFPPAFIFLAGALLLPFLPRRAQPGAFLLFPALGSFLLWHLEPGTRLVVSFLDYELIPSQVDRLSLAFGYVFTLIAFLGGIYGFRLMGPWERLSALLYAGSALGVVFAGDLFTLFVFWEIMALASVYLIWARRRKQSYEAGMRYLLVHLFGGSVLLAGILLHFRETGSVLFYRFDGGLGATLILFSFALNAAVPPLHAWLSDSYPEATVSGSVFLSAFTTKAAVYVLARGFGGWEILLWAGAVMAVYGVVYAVLENDIRRLLAYHIVSQVGYMVAGVGIGTEAAINGSTAHAFAHILYKGLLFMGAGAVLHATGRSKLTELGGLSRLLPWALGLYMVGAFSISGVPLFSGFVSKSLVIHAAEVGHQSGVVLLLHLASVGTFLSVGLKLPYFTWLARGRSRKVTPAPRSMYTGMALTALINLAIGMRPALLYDLMPFPVDYRPYAAAHITETVQILLFTAFGFWLLLGKLGAEGRITLDTDWFYRRPARLIYRMAVVSVSGFFAAAESLLLDKVRALARMSRNPAGSLREFSGLGGGRRRGRAEPALYQPDRYRPPLATMVLVLLLCFMALLVANLLVLYF